MSRRTRRQKEVTIKTIDRHGTFEEIMAGSSRDVAKIAYRLRELIQGIYPDVVEVPWPKQRIAGYGVGPKKMSEHFCYIAAQREYVNLGFYYGADLADPEDLLEGTGKSLRHVKVRELGDADRPALRELVRFALAERRRALGIEG